MVVTFHDDIDSGSINKGDDSDAGMRLTVSDQALLIVGSDRRFPQTLLQKRRHRLQKMMVGVHRVIDPETFTAVADHGRSFQISEMPGDGRLRQKEGRDNIADTKFSFRVKEDEDTQAGFVGEGLEE